ncbi:MAG: aminoglycoside phosphotransferase family protein [Vicinamibacteria bacterium]
MTPEERLREFLEKAPDSDLASAKVEKLAGDASNRLYFRIQPRRGPSKIVALLPAAFEGTDLPFLEVSEVLDAIPLRVPRVHEVAPDLGILLLEDLGDVLLQDAVENGCPGRRKRELYREAVAMIGKLQSRGRELGVGRFASFGPFAIAFDEKKFFDELSFFRRHFVEGFSARTLSEADSKDLEAEFHRLASELSSQPYALCHRDFHSRNLLVFDGGLAVIDYQDARMGPRCYDLASLLNDSYVAHEAELVSEMKDFFSDATGADTASEYDVAALQRNLKALGTFGYQIASRRNDVFRRYIGHTLALVRANLEANPRWDRLRWTLGRLLPELT